MKENDYFSFKNALYDIKNRQRKVTIKNQSFDHIIIGWILSVY
jgi:hypothetical protein